MRIDRSYLGNQNTYAENNPKCIVVHNTDNFAAGADARAHARAQHDGNFQNISAHYYVDDGDTAYQAAPHSRGCWHVGINYGGKNLFQQYGNKNSIGVEMCVQAGYNYEKAFENTAALVREIMRETGIPLERVYRHYDICSKYCPSQIMNRGDWDRMKRMIGSGAGSTGTGTAGSGTGKTYAPGIYQVQTAALNIRQAPDADSRIAGTIRDQGSYTVTEIQNTSWGRLLSGAGWVNCIGVEMCVQAGYNYEKAFENTAALVREIMRETGIPLERVYRHYDICSKYCPSQIMNRGDWDRMKRMIGSGAGSTGTGTAGSGTGKTYAPGIYQVQTAALNIRQAPDADSRIAGTIRDQGSYTVTEIQNTSWGRLLSGAGWVNCHTAYCRYAGPAKEKSAETAKSSGKTVAEDGIWGENLTRRLQELFGTPQDGKISNQLAVNRKFCDGITAAEWDSTPKGGSALVKEMQKWASAGMDGYIGPQTILAWQKKLGTPIDGTVSSPSAMVKKLQKWCNQK